MVLLPQFVHYKSNFEFQQKSITLISLESKLVPLAKISNYNITAKF